MTNYDRNKKDYDTILDAVASVLMKYSSWRRPAIEVLNEFLDNTPDPNPSVNSLAAFISKNIGGVPPEDIMADLMNVHWDDGGTWRWNNNAQIHRLRNARTHRRSNRNHLNSDASSLSSFSSWLSPFSIAQTGTTSIIANKLNNIANNAYDTTIWIAGLMKTAIPGATINVLFNERSSIQKQYDILGQTDKFFDNLISRVKNLTNLDLQGLKNNFLDVRNTCNQYMLENSKGYVNGTFLFNAAMYTGLTGGNPASGVLLAFLSELGLETSEVMWSVFTKITDKDNPKTLENALREVGGVEIERIKNLQKDFTFDEIQKLSQKIANDISNIPNIAQENIKNYFKQANNDNKDIEKVSTSVAKANATSVANNSITMVAG